MHSERGQTSAEYLGVIVVVAAIIAALAAGGVGERIGSALETAVCEIAQVGCDEGDSAEEPPPSPEELVDRYIDAPLDEFLAYRDSADRDDRLDWSTDHCSAPLVGSTGVSFDFTDACIRHDFGYRNTKRLGTFAQEKDRIDNRFLQDMKDHCATRSILLRGRCYQWAYTFYYGVRAFG